MTPEQLSDRNRKVALAAAKSPARRQNLSEWGRKGYKKAVAKHGKTFGLLKTAEYLRENQSEPERWVAGILDDLGIKYKAQYVWANEEKGWIVDFANKNNRWVIQVDGWRNRPAGDLAWGETDPGAALAYLQAQIKYIESYGWRVLYIDTRNDSPETNEQKIMRFFYR
jgi:very-short-patch-repair endonuclease